MLGFFPEEIIIIFLNHSWQYLYHKSRRVVNNCCYWERRRELLWLVQVVPRVAFQVLHLQQVHIIFLNCYKYSHFSDFSQSYLYVMYLKTSNNVWPRCVFSWKKGWEHDWPVVGIFYLHNIYLFFPFSSFFNWISNKRTKERTPNLMFAGQCKIWKTILLYKVHVFEGCRGSFQTVL